tara:strand:- start:12279 stop:14144 length:1866 start_codon:yes stop_codon:yes gene_type:complete
LVDEGPAQASTGAVAIVGDFPELKPDTPKTFTNKLEQNAYFLNSNENLELIADLVYRPTADLNSSVQSLTIVNANRSTQASKDLGSILVSSKLYGVFGNRIKVKVEESGDLYNLYVRLGAEDVEKAVGIGEGNIADIAYTASQSETFNGMDVKIDATNFVITGKLTPNNATVTAEGDLVLDTTVASGQVTIASSSVQADNASVFEIVGVNLAGVATTETVTMAIGADTVTSTASFSSITSITAQDAFFDGDATITFPVYTKALADISDFGAELNNVVNLNEDLTGTFAVTTPARKTTGLNLDELTETSCLSTTVNFTKNAQTIADWFNTSSYVEATLQTRGAFTASSDYQRLSFGSKATSISDSEYQSAFDSLKAKNVNIVVPLTTDIDIHKMARQHAIDSASNNGNERNVWVGATSNLTVENTYTQFSRVLNDRNVAVVNQSIKLTNGKTYGPEYLALVLASMQGATSVGTPLTRKRPTPLIVETVQNFDVEAKANLAIQRGIVLLTDPRGTGLNVERSVTTYLDDNKVFSEVSANESLNIAVRTVRADLQSQIGTKVTGGKANDIRRIVSTTLRDLTKVGFILSFKDIDVSISDDTANVSFGISVIQPLNFIVATINVG